MFTENDLLPISALQHYMFCPRQCGLIHLEQLWNENHLTAEGRLLHEKVHETDTENRPGMRIVRGLKIHSFRLGLVGQADVVEFRQSNTGIELPETNGLWQPFPVEYKRGRPKPDHCDEVQLCAQAMCLEEMLKITVPTGAFFYGKLRKRKEVAFTNDLMHLAEDTARQLHDLFEKRTTPTAAYKKKCESCSLIAACMPKVTGVRKNIRRYLAKANDVAEYPAQ